MVSPASHRRDPGSCPVEFEADKLALGSIGFRVSTSFHRCNIFTHVPSGGGAAVTGPVPQISLTPSQYVHAGLYRSENNTPSSNMQQKTSHSGQAVLKQKGSLLTGVTSGA
ncbi:hypothetical protein L798_09574 [Zootermopsis nevadensis]|uniref:Uncharacterized protein n=1 Tax=Zootermopsis nevadensis TaxID=136037 RepID=A0A067R014_ZOONE|nr:hypothetical protein L798_09574 [Zootermopsis nevadensis]